MGVDAAQAGRRHTMGRSREANNARAAKHQREQEGLAIPQDLQDELDVKPFISAVAPNNTDAILQSMAALDTATLTVETLETGVKLMLQWQAELDARANDVMSAGASGEAGGHVPANLSNRGPEYSALARSLYGTSDGGPVAPPCVHEDHSALFTNIPQCFLDLLLGQLRPRFLIEVGSWKGGSARRIASAAVASIPAGGSLPCLLCIDTWLGDGGAWIDRCVGWRDGLLLENGMPQLLWQFLANVKESRDVILAWPIASITALRTLTHLILEPSHGVPRPDFVYLDAAHEKGETLLEIQRAFELLHPGGVLVGDDLDWFAVESDLQLFCSSLPPAAVCASLDPLLSSIPHLYPTSEGYWVLDSVPRQWVLRKAVDAASDSGSHVDGSLAVLRAAVEADEYGPHGEREYTPLHDRDRAALELYEEAVTLSEKGSVMAASRLFKQAAAASPSLAQHYKLEAFSTVVERSLELLSQPRCT